MNNKYDYESYLENTNNNDINKHLIYEGEYKNGLRNGKGNGKRIDYGSYFKCGKLRFEGEYLNDKEWI